MWELWFPWNWTITPTGTPADNTNTPKLDSRKSLRFVMEYIRQWNNDDDHNNIIFVPFRIASTCPFASSCASNGVWLFYVLCTAGHRHLWSSTYTWPLPVDYSDILSARLYGNPNISDGLHVSIGVKPNKPLYYWHVVIIVLYL